MAQHVPDNINFPFEEEKIQEFWKKIDAFKTSLKLSKGKPRYSFYDGPPFATGLPHYGHILAGTIKDVVTRWAHQSGFHVERRFGWDCHGLPVEYEIDKTLGIRGPEDVAKMGIEAYNQECRKIVMRYSKEWEEIICRLGRWIDFENDYKTMYPSFMETIWWVFKQLYCKGLVYKGYKVMPFSTACNTPLSNFESGQNYKEVVDPAVIVSFPLEEDADVSMIAWTTTPWTLPSNLSLCVNPSMTYVKVKDNNTNRVYIMMEDRLSALFQKEEEYTILDKFKGKTLEGKHYKPLFPYFKHLREKTGAFRILTDNYVTSESGTGVVHQAPYFGEDDQRVCLANKIITKDMDMVCPVDASGRFTAEVTHFSGKYVKDADKEITKKLKSDGRLVHQGTTKHSYPFCWRSETPLIYKAVPSWFVRVEQATHLLLEQNQKTYWVPEFVKEKRFANWLRDARDWAISRNRYWGTPIPLWISDDGEEIVCVGSIEELQTLTGEKITDLHRESIDKLTIPSKMGKGDLRRISEVFDCWFESGSMPYAQNHYPFEKKKEFDDSFPADFIAEGIDQTRGWFYTLLVLSTLLFGKPPFKNLVANGLVLAADGQKMSKRKKNYPDPMEIVHKYGADALRLYLVNSPSVRAENLKFKEDGVYDVLKDVFLPWFNAYRFLMQNVERLERENGVKFAYSDTKMETSENYMDRWILSFSQSLIKFVKKEMAAYHLYTVVPRLVKFVDQLTNWYVRMNRKRLKGDGGPSDCLQALESLFSVIFNMIKVMSPFTPHLTEYMYQNMRNLLEPVSGEKSDTRSVHFLMLPHPRESLIDVKIENAVSVMQTVIELGRVVRDRKTLPLKYPLKEVVVIHQDPRALEDVRSLKKYILEELNVRELTTTTDKEKYGIHLKAEPDHKVLGVKLKGDFKPTMAAIQALTDAQLVAFKKTGEIVVCGHTLLPEDLRLMYTFQGKRDQDASQYEAHSEGELLILLDVTPDQLMLDEGIAREVINRIQKLRKKAALVPSHDITAYYKASPDLSRIIDEFTEFICSTIKQPLSRYPVRPHSKVIIQENMMVKANSFECTIVEGHGVNAAGSELSPQLASVPVKGGITPKCKFVNVELCGTKPQEGVSGVCATILLENPAGRCAVTMQDLRHQATAVFGLRGLSMQLFLDADLTREVKPNDKPIDYATQTFFLAPNNIDVHQCQGQCSDLRSPVCHFVNVELVRKTAKGEVKGTLLLENPCGDRFTTDQLTEQVKTVFDLNSSTPVLSRTKSVEDEIHVSNITSLHSETLYAIVN
ncbi:isoleucine--tRNA ligase, cytoplasmic-like [Gigantopelta aegis]|uniref:isoleucine--tRNA ligase, cytoplasmic-like n=1 Tax=Gigantopelta aegis TaxID=1735272 RepID=UPI001B889DD8|nr:isoleucine--tRNA ligase, cytoplasmic-like [Gigantopelta aegis]